MIKTLFNHIYFIFRFVWTVVVEKGKTCVECNYSRINFYMYNLKSTKIESDNIDLRKKKSWINNNNTITLKNIFPTLHRVLQYFS